MLTRDPTTPPTHPGVMLRDDVLPATDWTCATLAVEVGVEPARLDRVLNGLDPMPYYLAQLLGELFGSGTALLTQMQAARDAWFAEKENTP